MPGPDQQADHADGPAQRTSVIDRRYAAWSRPLRRAPGGTTGLRVVVFLLGLVFVLGGIALVVLPGPLTIPPILVGVYLWSLEFGWARSLRARAMSSADDAWQQAKRHPGRAGAVTVLGLVAAGVAVWAVTAYDLVARAKDAVL